MENLNDMAQQTNNPLAIIAAKILPNVYDAMSLSDFEREHKQVEPTTKLWPFGIFYLGSAVICFRNRLVLSKEGKSICGRLQLSDMNTTLLIEDLITREEVDRRIVNDRTRLYDKILFEGKVDLYDAGIKYHIKSGKVHLHHWNYQDKPCCGKRSKLETPLNIIWNAMYGIN